MTSKKRLAELIDYTSVLPYASELFGIYQPLLGWKSRRMEERFGAGFARDKNSLLEKLIRQYAGKVEVAYEPDCRVHIEISPGTLDAGRPKVFDSVLLKALAKELPPYDRYEADQWEGLLNEDRLRMLFETVVIPAYAEHYSEHCLDDHENPAPNTVPDRFRAAFESQLRRESSLAGALHFLARGKHDTELAQIFYSMKNNSGPANDLANILSASRAADGYLNLENLDPQDERDIKNVGLSPISVVHLFRQYFFELDSFLGTPVGHVWLSPGATVELIEVQTRKIVVEKSVEATSEITTKAESERTEEEEISDAVKSENKQNVKFGASVTASYASISATSSLDYNTSQTAAREDTHKRMRKQTEKLSTEIRKNYRTTFKTMTEATDTSSKRYVLSNTTHDLINYELRRKMRQVAVQVQDIGSYLCWQTYVDRPGESMGVAKLVHIAKPPELDGLHAPDEIPTLQPFSEPKMVTLPFISKYGSDADNEGEVYKDGVEVDDSEAGGDLEIVESNFPLECVSPKAGYSLASVEFDGKGKPVSASLLGDIVNADNKATFTLHLDSVDFQGQNSVQGELMLHWSPAAGANDDVVKKNKENVAAFKAKEAAEYQRAFVSNAKDRVKLMHQIKSRPSEDLREEERIVVYRELIQGMLAHGISMPDDRTRHVVAELINSIFDVDKMLYFVAPEWWRPRMRISSQQIEEKDVAPPSSSADPFSIIKQVLKDRSAGGPNARTKLAASTVGWGGLEDARRDNYYITDDSEPARFGSSLGWLLQLDGDNMRNAFLNAPWVKAVIPIRPGKEAAAVNWLQGVEGFNGIDATDVYQTTNANEKDITGLL